MPTKPSVTAPDWASDANYTSGPDIGKPTKYTIPDGVATQGHRGGEDDPTAAQYFNDFIFKVARLCRWVFLGSSGGEPDAHLVETNDNGSAALAHLVVISSGPPTQPGIEVVAPLSAPATIVRGNPASGLPALQVRHVGDGVGIDVDTDNAEPAATFRGNIGVSCIGVDASQGVVAAGGPTAPESLLAVAFGTNQRGISSYGSGTQAGVYGEATGTGAGVRGKGDQGVYGGSENIHGFGVVGTLAVGAASDAAGVRGFGFSNGMAGDFQSDLGYGVRIQNSAGQRASLLTSPLSADPTTHTNGGLWYRNGIGHSVRREGFTRRVHDSAKGRVFKQAYAAADSTTTDHFNPAVIATLTLSGADTVSVAGDVAIRLVADVGRSSAAMPGCNFGIKIEIDGIDYFDSNATLDPIQLFQSGGGVYERTIDFVFPWTFAVGDHTIIFKYFRQDGGGGDTVRYRRAYATVHGMF